MAGIIHSAAVSLSMRASTPAPYYIFFAAVEIPCTPFIIWLALRWKPDAGNPEDASAFARNLMARAGKNPL